MSESYILNYYSTKLLYSNYSILIHLGPLTYTNNEGKTTVFGIVSSDGNLRYPNGTIRPSTLGPDLYVRVSYPDILKWIKEGIKSQNN